MDWIFILCLLALLQICTIGFMGMLYLAYIFIRDDLIPDIRAYKRGAFHD